MRMEIQLYMFTVEYNKRWMLLPVANMIYVIEIFYVCIWLWIWCKSEFTILLVTSFKQTLYGFAAEEITTGDMKSIQY